MDGRDILATVAGLGLGVLMIAWAVERIKKIQKIVDRDPVELGPRLAMRIDCLIFRAARRHLEFIIIATKLNFRCSFVLNNGPVATSEAQDGIQ